MEQLLTIASAITTIFGALLSILGLVVLGYILFMCVKFNRLMQQFNSTASSIQQLTQLPMQVVNSLIQRLTGSRS